MLNKDYKQRPSSDDCFNHKWFKAFHLDKNDAVDSSNASSAKSLANLTSKNIINVQSMFVRSQQRLQIFQV